ncbi:MlaD family protein [Nocardia nova]|uniref:MlaD family protein n=1 Tax=Nocardia nova TaxID=37330 RepID=UPI0037AFB2A9
MKYRHHLINTAIKLGIAAAVSVVLFIIIINAIRNPVDAPQTRYTADFTDVSGLHVNGDVRTKGVLIGKVTSIELTQAEGRSVARVSFTIEKPYQLTDRTLLAVKYQNLTGIRYMDFEQTETGKPVSHLSADATKPSFDITQLFNGLQPVLSTMNSGEINTFMKNAITILQGDGGGLAPMLDSVQKLADYTHDREQVISTLTANLSRISDTLGGKSPELIDFLRDVKIPIAAAMTVLDEFRKTATFGPEFLAPLERIVSDIGLTADTDIDKLLHDAFSSVPAAADALRLLPGAFAGLQLPAASATPRASTCTNGVAQLPTDVKVLLNGSEVVICNIR